MFLAFSIFTFTGELLYYIICMCSFIFTVIFMIVKHLSLRLTCSV